MLKRSMASFAAFALLVGSALAGCDANPITVVAATDVVASASAVSSADYSWAELVSTPTSVSETTVVQVIGRQGGQIRVGDHSLLIPSKTVSENTEFTFTVAGGNHIEVHLSAKQIRDGAVVDRFSQALTLRLSYKNANVSDPSRLKNVFLVDGTADGRKQVLNSAVSTLTKTVASPVVHFSPYAMAMD